MPKGIYRRSAEHNRKNRLAHTTRPGISNRDRNLRQQFPNGKGPGIPFTEADEITLRAKVKTCQMCGKPEDAIHHMSGKVQRLSIDHDHKTGLVRGLLCAKCNRQYGIYELNKDLYAKYEKEIAKGE